MATLARLVVEMGLDDGLTGGLKKIGDQADAIGKKFDAFGEKAFRRMTLPLVGAGVAAVKWASDLNEAMSAADTIFGENAQQIEAWSKSAAKNLGMSRAEALTAATKFAALGQAAGQTGSKMVDFSTRIVQAAVDLGSFYNVPTGQALDALRSGLVGEYEPLRQFQIFLDDATVKAYAMSHGLADAHGNVSAGNMILARYQLILQGMGAAEGDRARTAGEFAGQMRTMNASFKDAAATLGTQFIPALTTLSVNLTNVAAGFQNLDPAMQKVITGFGIFLAILGPLAIVIGFVIGNITAIGAAFGTIIAPLTVFEGLLVLFAPILIPIATVLAIVKTNVLGLGDAVRNLAAVLGDTLSILYAKGVDLIQGFWNGIAHVWENLVTWLIGRPAAASRAVGDTAATLYDQGTDLLQGLWTGAFDLWEKIYPWFRDRPDAILRAFGDLSGLLYGVGTAIVQGLYNGLVNSASLITDAANYLVSLIPSPIRSLLGILSPSKVMMDIGENISKGLALGITQGAPDVSASMTSLGAMTTLGGSSGTSNSYGGITINVNGSGDPRATADEVFRVFSRELQLHRGQA